MSPRFLTQEHQMRKKRKQPAANTVAESNTNAEENIRHRAYQLYEERGREDGRALDDWLRAEAEVNNTGVPAS